MEPISRSAWHPAACSALEIELRAYKDQLDFQREVQLNKEPMRIDLLVIKKDRNVTIDIDIARIFSQYNIIEYKSPDDHLSLDDFSTAFGYAYWYKAHGVRENERKMADITVSLIRESLPQKLVKNLRELGHSVEKVYPGVYYVDGCDFRCQIIATEELAEKHTSLRILTKNLQVTDFQRFLEKYQTLDAENADAVLSVCTRANEKVILQLKKEGSSMCEALREIMREEIEEDIAKGIAKGIEKGIEKGREEGREEGRSEVLKTSIAALKSLQQPDEQIAKLLNLSLAEVKAIAAV